MILASSVRGGAAPAVHETIEPVEDDRRYDERTSTMGEDR